MKARAGLGFLAGALLVLSSLAHAFAGWPPLRSALKASAVDEGLIGALAVGWVFGSVAMLVFGVLVLRAAWQVVRGGRTDVGSVGVIAVAYLVFGLAAYFAREMNPHFLLFVVSGLLIGAFAIWRPR